MSGCVKCPRCGIIYALGGRHECRWIPFGPDPAASAEKAGEDAFDEAVSAVFRKTPTVVYPPAPAAPVREWTDCDCRDGGEFRAVCIRCGSQVDPSLLSASRAAIVRETVERAAKVAECWAFGDSIYPSHGERQMNVARAIAAAIRALAPDAGKESR